MPPPTNPSSVSAGARLALGAPKMPRYGRSGREGGAMLKGEGVEGEGSKTVAVCAADSGAQRTNITHIKPQPTGLARERKHHRRDVIVMKVLSARSLPAVR